MPKGAEATQPSPLRARPRNRAILVEAPVSSINQSAGIKTGLALSPRLARSGDIFALLLGSMRCTRSGNQLLLVFLAKFIERAVDHGDGAIDQGAAAAAREHAAEVDQGVHITSRA